MSMIQAGTKYTFVHFNWGVGYCLHERDRKNFISNFKPIDATEISRKKNYLYLSFFTGFTAHRSDDIIFLWPYFIIIHFQLTVVPAANIDIIKVVLPHFLKIHDFISWEKQKEDTNEFRRVSPDLVKDASAFKEPFQPKPAYDSMVLHSLFHIKVKI